MVKAAAEGAHGLRGADRSSRVGARVALKVLGQLVFFEGKDADQRNCSLNVRSEYGWEDRRREGERSQRHLG